MLKNMLCAVLLTSTSLFAQSPTDIVAHIGDRKVSVAEIMAGDTAPLDDVENQLLQCKSQYERSRHEVMESLVRQSVRRQILESEAKAKGISPEALLETVTVAPVTQTQIDAFYEENKARVPPNMTKEQIVSQIREYLTEQGRNESLEAFYTALESKHRVQVLLGPHRTTISGSGPARGPANAPVTIVEFSDFECPFCQRFNPALDQVRAQFGDKVRIVFRQYPLPIHPHAPKAAEASLCAEDQGKFWEMHDAIFKDRTKLTVADLKAHASSLNLDTTKFNACLDSGKHAQRVRADIKAGAEAGVSGTPAVFINGRFVGGAVPAAALATVIQEELRSVSPE